jgi:hypothetical protein
VALVRTDVSEELSASFIRVTRIGELGTTLAVTSNWCMLRRILGPLLFLLNINDLPNIIKSESIPIHLLKIPILLSQTTVE